MYEPPTLVEIGNFLELTLGPGEWGWDSMDHCWFIGCD